MCINKSGQRLNSLKIRNQGGFSMVEVLVTILVFAIGLLGVASLQTAGMRMVRDGGQLGQAAMLASSMADKMRANASGNNYVDVDGADRDCDASASDPPSYDCTIAQEDIFEWNDEIAEFLPGGSGSVTTNAGAFVINVTWSESQDSNQVDDTRTYSLAVNL